MIGKTVKVITDRPLGSRHPQYKNIVYTVNYGYIQNVFAGDREEQDAYVLGMPCPLKEFIGRVVNKAVKTTP